MRMSRPQKIRRIQRVDKARKHSRIRTRPVAVQPRGTEPLFVAADDAKLLVQTSDGVVIKGV